MYRTVYIKNKVGAQVCSIVDMGMVDRVAFVETGYSFWRGGRIYLFRFWT
jgi:hypothetical protein